RNVMINPKDSKIDLSASPSWTEVSVSTRVLCLPAEPFVLCVSFQASPYLRIRSNSPRARSVPSRVSKSSLISCVRGVRRWRPASRILCVTASISLMMNLTSTSEVEAMVDLFFPFNNEIGNPQQGAFDVGIREGSQGAARGHRTLIGGVQGM